MTKLLNENTWKLDENHHFASTTSKMTSWPYDFGNGWVSFFQRLHLQNQWIKPRSMKYVSTLLSTFSNYTILLLLKGLGGCRVTSATSEGTLGIFQKITFLKSLSSNEKDDLSKFSLNFSIEEVWHYYAAFQGWTVNSKSGFFSLVSLDLYSRVPFLCWIWKIKYVCRKGISISNNHFLNCIWDTFYSI